ncbi:hypothetical protein ACQ86N_02460 [Puia sp. P3]|uniref:hypothetical protein n=1 Tax=Puia sp. P3 TaxID=3423952 RepID=UPI003D679EE5
MIVAQKDLRKLMRPMHDALAYGAGLVLFKEDRVQENKNDISICMDYNDASEFLAGQPYDKHEFVWGDLRAYYEAMALLKKRRIPTEDFIYRESLSHQYVDIGKVVATRAAADRFEWGIRSETLASQNYGFESGGPLFASYGMIWSSISRSF